MSLLPDRTGGRLRSAAGASRWPTRRTLLWLLLWLAPVTAHAQAACVAEKSPPAPNAEILVGDWGAGPHNRRWYPATTTGLAAADIPRLTLRWVFVHPQGGRLRSQPAVTTDTIYLGSPNGSVFALDPSDGCPRWQVPGPAGVRTALVLADLPQGRRLFYGDEDGAVVARDARNGALLWRERLDPHPDAKITAAPAYHAGRLYVGISALEVLRAANPLYDCCTFRGGVAALDAVSGERLWYTPTIPTPARAQGRRGLIGTRFGPAGAPVWNTPTIDAARGQLYVGTGQNYTRPTTPGSNAVWALALADGALRWRRQLLADDAWNIGCVTPLSFNCPAQAGPDLDIGAAVMLLGSGAQQRLIVGQKTGEVYALSPTDGAVHWHRRLGRGGPLGGVHWGMASDGERLYVPISDADLKVLIFRGAAPPGPPQPALNALDARTGELRWRQPDAPCATGNCAAGMSAPPTATPAAIFAGSVSGQLRAYAPTDGRVLWQTDTAVAFPEAGSGAHGGAIDVDGPVVAGGLVLIHSGYAGLFAGGNVLLAYGVEPATPAP